MARDRKIIVAGTDKGNMAIFKLREDSGTYEMLQSSNTGSPEVRSVYISKNNSFIITGSNNSNIILWKRNDQFTMYNNFASLTVGENQSVDWVKGFSVFDKFIYTNSHGEIGVVEVDFEMGILVKVQEFTGDGRNFYSLDIASNMKSFVTTSEYSIHTQP